MKTAKQYISEARKLAEMSADQSAAEFNHDGMARLVIRNGVEASLLCNAIQLLEAGALFEIAGLRRQIADLKARLGEDDMYLLDHIERQLDERDRARDMNEELTCRTCAARQVA